MSDFYDLLDKYQITPNAFHILWCIHYKRHPVIVNSHAEFRMLINSGFIDTSYTIDQKGIQLIMQAEEVFGNNSKPEKKKISPSINIDDYVLKYLELFPLGKLPTGKPARVNKRNIIDAFKWFFANYDYSWETIMNATAYYVDTYEKDNFKFMRNSQYFIRKQSTDKVWDSDLASYCEIILNGGDKEEEIIHEKVV